MTGVPRLLLAFLVASVSSNLLLVAKVRMRDAPAGPVDAPAPEVRAALGSRGTSSPSPPRLRSEVDIARAGARCSERLAELDRTRARTIDTASRKGRVHQLFEISERREPAHEALALDDHLKSGQR